MLLRKVLQLLGWQQTTDSKNDAASPLKKHLKIFSLADLILFFTLCLCGFILTRHVSQSVPLDFHDESMYITAATGIFHIAPDWSPLYVQFLSLYFRFIQDPTDVYYLNIQALTIALPLLVYLLARILSASRFLAFAAAFILLLSTGNAPLVPKTHHFLIEVVLVLLIFLSLVKAKRRTVFGVFVIASVFLSYIRPEQLFSLFLFLPLFLFYSWKERARWWGTLLYLVVALISLNVLVRVFGGLPWGLRSANAFQQSYVFGYRSRISMDSSLSALTDEKLFQKIFDDASGIFFAVIRNPSACIDHWIWNFQRFISQCYDMISNHYVIADTVPILQKFDSYFFFFLYMFLIFPVIFSFCQSGIVRTFSSLSRQWLTVISSLLIFCLPSLVIALVFCSWERYLTPTWVFVLLLLPTIASYKTRMPMKKAILCAGLIAISAWVTVPRNLIYAKTLETDSAEKNAIRIRNEFLLLRSQNKESELPICLVNPAFYAIHLKCNKSMLVNSPKFWERPDLLLEVVSHIKPKYVLLLVNKWSGHEVRENFVRSAEKVFQNDKHYTFSKLGGQDASILGYLWVRRP